MKKAIITIGVIIVGIILILGLLKFSLESGIDEIQKKHYGEILLSNGYSVLKIHAQKGNVLHSPRNETSIGANIFEVGDNGKVIAYKREFGSNIEYGFIDTTNKNENYKPELVNETAFNTKIKELNITVISVDKLFPETKDK